MSGIFMLLCIPPGSVSLLAFYCIMPPNLYHLVASITPGPLSPRPCITPCRLPPSLQLPAHRAVPPPDIARPAPAGSVLLPSVLGLYLTDWQLLASPGKVQHPQCGAVHPQHNLCSQQVAQNQAPDSTP